MASKKGDHQIVKIEREIAELRSGIINTLKRQEESLSKCYRKDWDRMTAQQNKALAQLEKNLSHKRSKIERSLSKQSRRDELNDRKVIRRRLSRMSVADIHQELRGGGDSSSEMSMTDRLAQLPAANGPDRTRRKRAERRVASLERKLAEQEMIQRRVEQYQANAQRRINTEYDRDQRALGLQHMRFLQERQNLKRAYMAKMMEIKKERQFRLNQVDVAEVQQLFEVKRAQLSWRMATDWQEHHRATVKVLETVAAEQNMELQKMTQLAKQNNRSQQHFRHAMRKMSASQLNFSQASSEANLQNIASSQESIFRPRRSHSSVSMNRMLDGHELQLEDGHVSAVLDLDRVVAANDRGTCATPTVPASMISSANLVKEHGLFRGPYSSHAIYSLNTYQCRKWDDLMQSRYDQSNALKKKHDHMVDTLNEEEQRAFRRVARLNEASTLAIVGEVATAEEALTTEIRREVDDVRRKWKLDEQSPTSDGDTTGSTALFNYLQGNPADNTPGREANGPTNRMNHSESAPSAPQLRRIYARRNEAARTDRQLLDVPLDLTDASASDAIEWNSRVQISESNANLLSRL